MRAVRLDFVPQVTPRWPGYALLTLAVMGAGLVGLQYVRLNKSLAAAEQRVAALELRVRTSSTRPSLPPPSNRDNTLVQRALAVNQKLNLPWQRLFSTLESVHQQPVALLSVEPDSSNGSVRITAEAKDALAMLACIESLRDGGALSEVTLITHQILKDQPYKPVRFSFAGQWAAMP